MDHLTEDRLNEARYQGDPLADSVVARMLNDGHFAHLEDMMHTLVENSDELPPGLPDYLVDYLESTAVPAVDPPDILAGERFFVAHGPELCLILGCYSLPASYAAAKGVQVLHQTAYLSRRPNRRLAETGQMVIDVMSPGGLGPRGKGIRSAQKVRLYHASVRNRLLARGWDTPTFGLPINQEDMLGTLMVFAYLGIDGLRRMGLAGTPQEEQAYLDAWRAVGCVMGVQPELIPRTVAQAAQVTQLIQDRQIAPSAAGVEMTTSLLDMFEQNLPWFGRTTGAAMMRAFLPAYAADYLQVPRHLAMDKTIAFFLRKIGVADKVFHAGFFRRTCLRFLSLALLRWFDRADLNGKRTDFRIPTHLRTSWQADGDPSFWTILWRQLQAGKLP